MGIIWKGGQDGIMLGKLYINLITIQNHDFRLRLPNTLNTQYIPGIHARHEGSIALGQHRILPARNPDLRAPILAHREVHVDVAVRHLPHGVAAHRPFEALVDADDAGRHDEIRVDGDRVLERGLGGFFFGGGGAGPGLEGREDGEECGAFCGLVESAGMVAGGEAAGPWKGPDLEEVDGFVGLVAFGMCDSCPASSRVSIDSYTMNQGGSEHTSSASSKLHISPLHPVEIIALRTLGALLDHAIAVRQLAAQDIAEDFRIAVGMCREAGARRDAVLVEHAQAPEVLEARIVVVGEAEGMVGVQPAMVGMTALAGAAGYDLGVTESFGHGVSNGGVDAHRL